MDVSTVDVFVTDDLMASKYDKPNRFGLQTLTAEEQDILFEFLDSRLEPGMRTDLKRTSLFLARQAGHHFREMGMKIRISNLMVKSAMYLLGFKPVCENVDIMHYRIKAKDKEGSL